MNGGAGWRFFLLIFTLVTVKSWPSTAARTFAASSSLLSSIFPAVSPVNRARKRFPSFSRVTSMLQYYLGSKAFISRSRSTTILVTADWTRPAERPVLTFLHRKGDSL